MFGMDMIEVPDEKDPAVIRLLKNVGTHTPLYLDVEPDAGAKMNDCFPAVQKKVEQSGGRMVLGWQIWKNPNMIEAELHAVWEDPDEELHDITPKDPGINRIMFVEDENLVYDGKQKDNIRLNITTNPLVDDFIKINEAVFRFQNKGKRADLYDMDFINALSPEELQHFERLQELQGMAGMLTMMEGKRGSACPCMSGKKFNECHGKDLQKILSIDI